MAKISLNHICKVEGHATLNLIIDKGEVLDARLDVVEGARLFEAILRTRKFNEIPIFVSRICGVCSSIHHTTAICAVEHALKVEASDQTMKLRELMCMGELLQSHLLHLYLLALPDYFGYSSAIQMAEKYPVEVKRGLRLKGMANRLVEVIAGREIHPVTSVIGGFSKLPDADKLHGVLLEIKEAKNDFIATAELFKGIRYPELAIENQYYSLEKYKFLDADIVNGREKTAAKDYAKVLHESVDPMQTAKLTNAHGKSVMVGAMARIENNKKLLSKDAYYFADFPRNPFYNNQAQAAELVHCADKIVEILETLELRDEKVKEAKPKKMSGVSACEAPRGLLIHDYSFDTKGHCTKANIITPTAMNIANIERDIKAFLPQVLDKPKEQIVFEVERLIRSYDPCFSCSAHFLRVKGLTK